MYYTIYCGVLLAVTDEVASENEELVDAKEGKYTVFCLFCA